MNGKHGSTRYNWQFQLHHHGFQAFHFDYADVKFDSHVQSGCGRVNVRLAEY